MPQNVSYNVLAESRRTGASDSGEEGREEGLPAKIACEWAVKTTMTLRAGRRHVPQSKWKYENIKANM